MSTRPRSAANSGKPAALVVPPAVFDRHVPAFDIAQFTEPFAESGHEFCDCFWWTRIKKSNHRQRRLLRARRERPRGRRAAECGKQLPPSDGDCHTPLPCEVRKSNDPTPRACCP